MHLPQHCPDGGCAGEHPGAYRHPHLQVDEIFNQHISTQFEVLLTALEQACLGV